jgi:hypothetical protein
VSQTKEIHGWWRLVSFDLETQGMNERQKPFGANAFGRLVLSPNGHMIAVMTAEDRKAGQSDADHLALFRSMLAYTGKYRIEGDKFITNVDASWNEAWTGTDQERFFNLDGDRLDIVSAWGPHPIDPSSPPIRGILSWARET